MSPKANTAFQVPAVARSWAPGIMYVEVMNRVAVPFGLKVSSVASINSQDTRAAAAPAPRAQNRILPDRTVPRLPPVPAARSKPYGLALSAPKGDIGVGSG